MGNAYSMDNFNENRLFTKSLKLNRKYKNNGKEVIKCITRNSGFSFFKKFNSGKKDNKNIKI